MFLTEQELQQLTGYRYGKYQVQWLKDNHIAFKLNGLGAPVVLRSSIEATITGKVGARGAASAAEPNFGALRRGKKTSQQS